MDIGLETLNYGKFTAILQAITEKYCQFRSSIAGDTRQVRLLQLHANYMLNKNINNKNISDICVTVCRLPF